VAPSTAAAQVAFSSPADGSLVSEKVNVRIDVRSADAVRNVRLYVDDRLLATDYRQPYVFTWNTRFAVPGSSHTLTAVAYDRYGRQRGRAAESLVVAEQAVAAVTSSAPILGTSAFVDLAEDAPYAEAVRGLAEAGVVSGFEDGSFGADEPVTRAQLAKMAATVLGIADDGSTVVPFVDLGEADEDLYPHKYVASLFLLGALKGTSPSLFSPAEPATRAQVISILVRAVQALAPEGLAEPPVGAVSAVGLFDPSHDEAMLLAEYNGVLADLEDYGASWDPWAPATRGEVAQILRSFTLLE
jgi:hypothetical protein